MVFVTSLLDTANSWSVAVVEWLTRWGSFLGITNGGLDFNFETKANFISKILMGLYSWLGTYGWTIILFSLFLRIITLPLDFWQKFSMKKNSKIMGEITGIMEKIDKSYANDPKAAGAEKQKIMKKYGYSPLAMCLPTIVTVVVFMVMFSGFNNCSNTLNIKTYQEIQKSYLTAFSETIQQNENTTSTVSDGNGGYYTYMYYAENRNDLAWVRSLSAENLSALKTGYEQITLQAGLAAKRAAIDSFEKNREGFLWIKSLWRSDNWQTVLPENLSSFTSGLSGNKDTSGLTLEVIYDNIYDAFKNPEQCYDVNIPEEAEALKNAQATLGYGQAKWNGLLILPILAIVFTLLTSLISGKTQGNVGTGQQAATAKSQQKMMMFMMPAMMGIFALTNSAAFSLYLVASNIISIILNLIETPIIDKMVEKRQNVFKQKGGNRR